MLNLNPNICIYIKDKYTKHLNLKTFVRLIKKLNKKETPKVCYLKEVYLKDDIKTLKVKR